MKQDFLFILRKIYVFLVNILHCIPILMHGNDVDEVVKMGIRLEEITKSFSSVKKLLKGEVKR